MNSLTSAPSHQTQILYSLFIISLSLGVSGLPQGIFIQWVLPITTMFYLRSTTDALLFLFPLGLHYFISIQETSFLGIVILLCFGLILAARFFQSNILTLLKWIVPLSAGIAIYHFTSELPISMACLLIQIILMNEMVKDWHWMKEAFQLPSVIVGLGMLGAGILLYQYMPAFNLLFLSASFIFICHACEPLISITCFVLSSIFMPEAMPLIHFMTIFFLSLLKGQKKTMIMAFALILLVSELTLTTLFVNMIYFILFLLLGKDAIPFQKNQVNDLQAYNRKALMYRQLNHFAQIFENLAQYYQSVSELESTLLESMGKALDYTARKCKEESDGEVYKQKILNILEGYQIEWEDCRLEMSDDGRILLSLSLVDFKKSEVKEVLLPLLNQLLPTQMELVEDFYRMNPLSRNTYQFISVPPIQIDAYADSIKHELVSGDAFSIFRHARSVYCMISDGMGSGIEAGKISSSIANIFQRMIASNIPEVDAIFCINKLLQSDQYATMDVLSFDRYQKTVTICKSAACPTYLIRNHELYTINGHSLPIGIIAEIEVDHIRVHIEKNDWFLMSSDGVYVDEIISWLHIMKQGSAKEEIENLMQILNQKTREDDTTVLLAKVMS